MSSTLKIFGKVALLLLLGETNAFDFKTVNRTIASDGKCRALAMRGGGTKGAYEVGVLNGFKDHMSAPIDYAYDVTVGVSIGAINSASLAVYPIGDEKEALEELTKRWLANPMYDLLEQWPILSFVETLWRPSAFNNEGLRKLISEQVDGRSFMRGVAMQAVDLNTGEVVIFDEETPKEKLVDAIMSSASIPVAFPPIMMDDKVLVDGGAFSDLDLSEAVMKCRDFGFDDEDIIVDILMCFNNVVELKQYTMAESKYLNAYELYQRTAELRGFYGSYEDVTRVVRGFPRVTFRHLVAPSEDLEADFFTDGPEKVQEMMDKGYRDAGKTLEAYYDKLCEEEIKDKSKCWKVRIDKEGKVTSYLGLREGDKGYVEPSD